MEMAYAPLRHASLLAATICIPVTTAVESSDAPNLAALRSMAMTSRPSFVYRHLLLVLLVAAAPFAASAAGMPEYSLTIQNRRFEPATLKAPANTKFKMLVTNKDSTLSEFESNEFNREKIVPPNSAVTVFIGPLDKGTYKFYDDFNRAATGILIVE